MGLDFEQQEGDLLRWKEVWLIDDSYGNRHGHTLVYVLHMQS